MDMTLERQFWKDVLVDHLPFGGGQLPPLFRRRSVPRLCEFECLRLPWKAVVILPPAPIRASCPRYALSYGSAASARDRSFPRPAEDYLIQRKKAIPPT